VDRISWPTIFQQKGNEFSSDNIQTFKISVLIAVIYLAINYLMPSVPTR